VVAAVEGLDLLEEILELQDPLPLEDLEEMDKYLLLLEHQ
jgi:hypothetical protein